MDLLYNKLLELINFIIKFYASKKRREKTARSYISNSPIILWIFRLFKWINGTIKWIFELL